LCVLFTIFIVGRVDVIVVFLVFIAAGVEIAGVEIAGEWEAPAAANSIRTLLPDNTILIIIIFSLGIDFRQVKNK
jgi:hypothetical protein